MLSSILLVVAGGALTVFCSPASSPIDNLVSFGDSYTDEGRLSAYADNHGQAPPPATNTSGSNATASGGHSWGYFASLQLGAKYYDYAVSGAFCSNEIFSRYLSSINRTYPSVIDDEIPSYLEDIAYVNTSTGSNTFYTDRGPDNTVYALWIGTNDLGLNAFLTDSQHKGLTITDFVDCIWQTFDSIYSSGGRRFILFNLAPLEHTPMYAAPQDGGAGDNQDWTNKTLYNMTTFEQKILEYTSNVNTMFDYGVPFLLRIKERWPNATFTIFNVHQLLLDIISNPSEYLDAPANATGYFHHCSPANTSDCTNSNEPQNSFLWYDPLHPSNKTDEIIGTEFAKVVNGQSDYATVW